MIQKALKDIKNSDIEDLILNKVFEIKTLDYKRELSVNTDSEKKEFLADIASFANASGGDLVFGVEAEKGIPVKASGIPCENQDDKKLRLEQIVRAGLDPRIIPGVQFWFVDGFELGPVLIIRVSKSWTGPHMVGPKEKSRFYARHSSGKYSLDSTEIRSAFIATENLQEKIQSFRDERIGKIIANEAPLPMDTQEKLVLHVLPINSLMQWGVVDIPQMHKHWTELTPLGRGGAGDYRVNFDGLLTYNINTQSNTARAYCQMFRSGKIESVTATFVGHNDKQRFIGSSDYEIAIVNSVFNYLNILKNTDAQFPIVVLVSMLGVLGVDLAMDFFGPDTHPIDRDILFLPDVVLEEHPTTKNELAKKLKPIFDAVWNACGCIGSANFNEQGEWAPKG